MPAAVDERNKIVEKRMQRRIYVADYSDQRDHIDLECKLIFGRVRLYIYGQVCAPPAAPAAAPARASCCRRSVSHLAF